MMRASGKPYESMAVMIIGAVLSIILSFLFVIVLELGVRGAAASTVIAQAIAMSFALYIFLRRKNTTLRLKLKHLKIKPKVVASILAVGVSPFFGQIMGSVVMALANNSLWIHGEALGVGVGDLAIGAKGVMINFIMLFMMPIFGINQGAQPLLGFNYGAKRYDRVKTTLKYAITTAAIVSLIGWCFMMFFPQVPVWMFTGDLQSELAQITFAGMPIFAGAFAIVGVQFVQAIFFQAIGKAKIALVLNMLRQAILFTPLLFILPPIFGLRGIWYAGLTADIIAFTVTTIIFVYTIKTKLKVTPDMGVS